jgi:hypothetical protein
METLPCDAVTPFHLLDIGISIGSSGSNIICLLLRPSSLRVRYAVRKARAFFLKIKLLQTTTVI